MSRYDKGYARRYNGRAFKDIPRCCLSCEHWSNPLNFKTLKWEDYDGFSSTYAGRSLPASLNHVPDEHCTLGVPASVIQDSETFVCSRHEIKRPDPVLGVSGLRLRPFYDDAAMCSEAVRIASALHPTSDDVFLDLGAHIGSCAWAALRNFNVARCVAVEADPINLPVLHMNLDQFGDRASIIPCAVVDDQVAEIPITLWRTGFTGGSSIQQKTRRFSIQVNTVGFQRLLAEVRPTLIKIDVEGAEFGFDWHVNDELRGINAELHRSGEFSDCDVIIETLENQGFTLTSKRKRAGFMATHFVRPT